MKKIISIILAVSILMSALSLCLVSHAEGQFTLTTDEYTCVYDSDYNPIEKAGEGDKITVFFKEAAIDSEKYYYYGYTVETATQTLYFESDETFTMPAEDVSIKAIIKEKTVGTVLLSDTQPVDLDFNIGMALCESDWIIYSEKENRQLDFNADGKADAKLIEIDLGTKLGYKIALFADRSAPDGEYTLDVSQFGSMMPYSAVKVVIEDSKKPAALVTAKTTYKGVYGKALSFSVKVTNANGKALAGKKVVIVFNGKTYTKITNAKGLVTFSISSTTVPKTYACKISCEGVTKTVKIVIQKAAVKLKAPAKAFKQNKNIKKYTVTLKNNNNKAIKNIKITLKVNKKTYTAKTNAKGVATFKIKIIKKGNYTAKIKFAGNKYYKAASKSAKIKIK